jgi:two-component system nitrogen regulation sensor histidine kinase NtrY
VITFEDITRQLITQRRAAWSDVARRIAHEIKNPLTPIQLATERLKRRYRRQIVTDPELFEELTATIIRQVGDCARWSTSSPRSRACPSRCSAPRMPAIWCVRRCSFRKWPMARSLLFSSEAPMVPFECDRHQFGR